jgi:replicative DNA helicase
LNSILTQEEIERKILAFILQDINNLRQAVAKNIGYKHFIYSPESDRNRYYRAIFNIIVNYFYRFQTLATEETFIIEVEKKKFSESIATNISQYYVAILSTDVTDSNFEYLLEQLRNNTIVERVSGLIPKIRKLFIDEDNAIEPIKALQVLKEDISNIENESVIMGQASKTFDASSNHSTIISLYDEEKIKLEQTGSILLGLSEIDEQTNGLRGGQLVLFMGEVGKGKSTTLLNCAINAHSTGKNILFFSWEMPIWQCLARFMAIKTGIEYKKFKTFSLEKEEMQYWENFLKEEERKNDKYFIFVDQPDNCTLEEMDYHCRNLINSGNKPDAIFVDYLGNMRLSSGMGRDLKKWEMIALISIKLRAMARIFDVPIITAQQVNREALKANRKKQENNEYKDVEWSIESIADAKATADYADAIIGLSPQFESGPFSHSLMWFHLVKGRDFYFEPFSACYDPLCSKITSLNKTKDVMKYLHGGGDQSVMAEMYNNLSRELQSSDGIPKDFFDDIESFDLDV